jgi:hypothetical protein
MAQKNDAALTTLVLIGTHVAVGVIEHQAGKQQGIQLGYTLCYQQQVEPLRRALQAERSENQQLLSILQTAVQQVDTDKEVDTRKVLADIREALRRIEGRQVFLLPQAWSDLGNGNSATN